VGATIPNCTIIAKTNKNTRKAHLRYVERKTEAIPVKTVARYDAIKRDVAR
jgi:hypothetical protein